MIEEGMYFGLWWQCWLKVQEDLLAPQVQDTGPHVAWTSGLIYREGTGVIGLETERGVVHIQVSLA
jgi:hypothetical protein